ncbi:MAG: NAD-glutamate dehydrogenase [Gemmatimonadales bacterium]|nr:MAG: NAD-glutamate dehydrogenase [Gemmatimonadales bacterium]
MSDTSEAAVARLRREALEIEQVAEEIERLVPEDERDLARRFAELFFSKAPPEFLRERGAPSLARLALGAFRFLDRARPYRVDVEVLNPDVDQEGWFAPVTVIRTNISERPFIVDTIREFLHSRDLAIEVYIYPVLQVERDEDGRILALGPSAGASGRRESLVHCEITRVGSEERREELASEIEGRLRDVVLATDDFEAMLDAADEAAESLDEASERLPERAEEMAEVQAFLEWLRDGGFVFLGYRGYDLVDTEGGPSVVVEEGSGLGILRSEDESSFAEPVPLLELPEGLREMAESGPILIISKTNATSTVHRRARMDYIGVKKLDEGGRIVGERRFVGLFTSEAYSEKADRIPILRQKLDRILADSGVQAGSHDYKEINTIFNTLPKEELFLTSAEEIGDDVRTVLTTFDSEGVRVTLRRDPLQRGVSLMVILAKERFSGDIRKRIEEAFVDALDGEVLNYHLALGEGDQARLHFYLAVPQDRYESVSARELEELVRQITRSWTDRVREGLERVRPAEEARRLAARYGEAFSAEYQAATVPATAVRDILELEAMRADGRKVAISLTNPVAEPAVASGEAVTELNLYLRDSRLILSDFMPILENAGLRVVAVTPYEVRGEEVAEGILYSFVVQDPRRRPLDIEGVGSRLSDAILATRRGEATNDTLNALVVSAGLAWREVEVLRAYAGYGFQAGLVPSRMSLPVALNKYPEVARLLFRLFEARFDPDGPRSFEERSARTGAIRNEILRALDQVTVLSDDRAIRRVMDLVEGTLRTNYFQTGGARPSRTSGGVPYLSLKFDAVALDVSRETRLRYEVWVRSSRMEGVHLRGARVARGGIRYSDRADDFRTEVLGLVKTQMVKNAVIVPAGSKGGFVTLRQLPPEEMVEEARQQYRTLIRGLLDLTDNLRGDENIPPERVVAWDEPDPYLVVAADKGTATFSDMANEVAAEYDFWLGDAFASGGSNGYDHKEVGITARGAWECVKRHFMEMGKDIQSEPFTVVGIGDMSGDVFGNGMLLSRQIRLLAAFDHRDIFIDPDPDPAVSWEERNRLFQMGRCTWQDYDRSLLSDGAMIIPRGSKAVDLTPQAREVLDIGEEGPFDGETLIRHILRAPAELLWNGGIGTYVKAARETHAQVGDAANDAVRVDGAELRAQVVGEGGNLGLTQEGRIEYALAGGRLNTDAIDNSGGVDLSDREVNLKILLRPVVESGDLEPEARNDLLRELQDPVASLVLADNESQGMAISLDEARAGEGLDDLRDLMAGLERAGLLSRRAEHLPTWEMLEERKEEGRSLTRPELSILLGYAKLHLTASLLGSDVPDDPAAEPYLSRYFPSRVVEVAGPDRLSAHRLRREIVASQLANDLVDLMGAGFVHRVVRGTGRTPAQVARAWLVASHLVEMDRILGWLQLDRGAMPMPVAYRWILGLSRVLERTTRWILANEEGSQGTAAVVEASLRGLEKLREAFPQVVAGEDRRIFLRLVEELEGDGARPEFARNLITLRFLDQLLEILRVHRETGADPLDAASAFYRLSELFWIPWLRQAVFDMAGDDRWEQRAAQALSDDLTRAHQKLVLSVVHTLPESGSVDRAVDHLARTNSGSLQRYQDLVQEVEAEGSRSLAAFTVVVRELVALSERVGREPAARQDG